MSSRFRERYGARLSWSAPATAVLVLLGLAAAVPVIRAASPLRVCADPNNLPFSNRQQEGFENRIAAVLNPPPAHALGRRGIVNNVVGYSIFGDYSKPNPPAELIHAVAGGEVDVAVVWGPFAGYFGSREKVPMKLTPVVPAIDPPALRFTFAIAVGVRREDSTLRARLDAALLRGRSDIQGILHQYQVPLVSPRASPEWRVVADVPLPGKAARFDYQSFDLSAGRLWIAHMGAGEVLAFDVRSRKVVVRASDMPGVTGVLAVPALQRVFASLSGSREVAVLDSQTGQVLRRVPGGRFPDGLAYAPHAHKLFVSDEYGRQELVLEVATSTSHPPIPMGGEVGNPQYDSVSGRIWVAVQTRNELAAIDPMSDSVVAQVPVPGIEHPHGIYVDAIGRRIYVTGEENATVGVLDLRTNRMLRTYPVGDDPDVLAMDPSRRRLFVASESGILSAFDVRGDSLVSLPRYVAPHAHSVAVDPATHLLYLPLQSVGGRPVLRILTQE